MSTPAGPVEVPLRRVPPPQSGQNSSSSLSRFLATRNGKIAAAAGVVVLYALYRRYKTNSAAAAAATTGTASTTGSAGAGIPTADTTATDLYSQLEPLLENASGFTGTQSILQQLQSLQASLGKGQTTGAGTPGGATQGPGPLAPKFPTQVHAVGVVGQNSQLRQSVARFYPTANAQQQDQIVWNTIFDPANKQYQSALSQNIIPGGARVTFDSAPVK